MLHFALSADIRAFRASQEHTSAAVGPGRVAPAAVTLAELREGAAVRAGPGAGLRLPHRPSWFHRVLWCRREVRGATKR